jgi:alkylglycerol monooxygenase
MLILWDRMFGTFEDETDVDPVVFGVRKPLANWNPFWANLQVYDYLLFDAVRTHKWRDKLGVWFRRTGWRPADVAVQYPKPRVSLSTFEKFDPVVAAPARRYVLAQFLVAIVGTLVIAELFVNAGARSVLIPCVLLWVQLYGLGLLNEGRPYARKIELWRLLVIVPVGVAGLQYAEPWRIDPVILWGGASVYVISSLLALTMSYKQ